MAVLHFTGPVVNSGLSLTTWQRPPGSAPAGRRMRSRLQANLGLRKCYVHMKVEPQTKREMGQDSPQTYVGAMAVKGLYTSKPVFLVRDSSLKFVSKPAAR